MEGTFTLNLGGRIAEFRKPAIMAIINATPDSFYGASRSDTTAKVAAAAERALAQGADMLDLGAYSSRPGAADVSPAEESRRLVGALKEIRRLSADIPVSVDTFRAPVAQVALDNGADIINDISGGMADPGMDALAARTGAPYIVMHMRGTPATMQGLTDYSAEGGVTAAVMTFFARRISELQELGVNDIILDPGFGFAKTTAQNYELLRDLSLITHTLQRPVLVGVSRKSMFYRPLGLTPADVLPATRAANRLAAEAGAAILRVHDPERL